ncbi:MAG: Flp pilus assembly protein CpaB [Acidimicrobiia bacterium]|nr:Flp pilus assembly protein CpaB [Acidimicrobiia bacterium]
MFRRSPRTAMLWAAAALVAVVTATTVIGTLSSLRHQDQAFGALSPIVVARRDLPVGTRLTHRDLAVRQLRGESPDSDALSTTAAAEGRTLTTPLLRGGVLTRRHLAAADRSGLGAVIPRNRRAVRLVVEHGVQPAVGDLVDVLATFDPATLGDGGDPTIVVAAAVPVLTVEPGTDAGDTVAITVLVTPRTARRLAFSSATGTLSLSLAPPEAATGNG